MTLFALVKNMTIPLHKCTKRSEKKEGRKEVPDKDFVMKKNSTILLFGLFLASGMTMHDKHRSSTM